LIRKPTSIIQIYCFIFKNLTGILFFVPIAPNW